MIDPGGDCDKIMAKIPSSVKLEEIWLTHSHIDHVGGVKALIDRTDNPNIKLIGSKNESVMRQNMHMQASMLGLNPNDFDNMPEPSHFWEDIGPKYTWRNTTWSILFTPGHSPGHYSFLTHHPTREEKGTSTNTSIVIAGDCLFRESVGRTDLPGGDWATLEHSIRNQLWPLSNTTIVYPGHGPSTTIGHEKQYNPFLT